MAKSLPAQNYLLSAFRYDPESGLLYWRARTDMTPQWNAKYAGEIAGNRSNRARVELVLNDQHFRAHRIIWKMVYGTEPAEIDHIDCDPHNNRLANLRECTRTQNAGNMRGRASSGYKGVTLHRKSGLWRARLTVAGKEEMLGYFRTPDAAHAAYVAAAEKHFGEFARAA